MNELFILVLLLAFYLAAYIGFDGRGRSFDVDRIKRVVTFQGGVKSQLPTLNRLLGLVCLTAFLLGHPIVSEFKATKVLLLVHAGYSFYTYYGSSKLPKDIQAASKNRSGQIKLVAWGCGSLGVAMVWLLPPNYLSWVGFLGLVHFFGMETDSNFKLQELHPAAFVPLILWLYSIYKTK